MKVYKIAALMIAVLAQTVFGFAPDISKHDRFSQESRDINREFRGHSEERERPPRIFEELELTDAQKESIKAVFEQNRETAHQTRERIKVKFEEIREGFAQGISMASAETIVGEIMDEERQLAIARVSMAFSIKSILTEQQIEKLPPDFFTRIVMPVQGHRERGEERRPPNH
ncbi:Spy/CpxP family protein refolding chaperone [candidate division WOR-3 bacterium]|nr:Spy/CpxP family protein refolding chaperone [candidate division WOR-3 bacterium]